MSKRRTQSKDSAKTLRIAQNPDETKARALAKAALRPSVRGAVTVREFSKSYGDIELTALVDELAAQAKAVNDGDLARAEAMLAVQAHTLDALFNHLLLRAKTAEVLPHFEAFMRYALRAQNQCRATLETLAAVKNPAPVAIVRQANIAHGPQQVNNAAGICGVQGERARENLQTAPNELLERTDGERLDGSATQDAIGSDPRLAPVGAIDGTANGGR